MLYDYDLHPAVRRLVLCDPGQPSLCIPIPDDLYQALRREAGAHTQALLTALTQALRQALAAVEQDAEPATSL